MTLTFSPQQGRASRTRGAGVTAVLGPTNTGKTHLAIERMLAHSSGMIGLPLRLLAREVYNKVLDRVGADAVALITGEEKIKPANPRFWVCTVEAMPRDIDVAFLAIDEIQLGADLDRGHVFTDRILNRRAREETMVLGAATVRPMVEKLLPGAHIISRPRLSMLTYAGEKKLTRLPARSAVVAFSAEEVYAIAELIRRQRGGAAVVLGALSPRTRNAQVALYQAGDVDYLVATDAIGMGLNLDVDHVAFASDRKFDGYQFRKLNPAELAQIAGRAGRCRRDGRSGPSHARRNLRHDRPLRSVRAGIGAGAGKPRLRSDPRAAMAQLGARLRLDRRFAGFPRHDADRAGAHARAGRGRYFGAGPCRA
jgi:ATP-dependent RNA helicase SUPV3L1/SUV3